MSAFVRQFNITTSGKHRFDLDVVKVGSRFVGDDERRIMREGPSDRNALLLATRRRADGGSDAQKDRPARAVPRPGWRPWRAEAGQPQWHDDAKVTANLKVGSSLPSACREHGGRPSRSGAVTPGVLPPLCAAEDSIPETGAAVSRVQSALRSTPSDPACRCHCRSPKHPTITNE